MDIKNRIASETSEISEELEAYIQSRINLTKLHIAEDISRFFSSAATLMVIFYLGFFAIFMLALAAAYYINGLLGSKHVGFFIISGLFLFLAFIFFLLRKSIVQKPVIKAIIHLFFPKYHKHE